MAQIDGVFDIGDEVTVEGRFRKRSDHSAIAPDTVTCAVKLPNGDALALNPAADPTIVGLYTAKFVVSQSGDHGIRMAGSAPAQVASEIVITVRPRRVPEPAP